MTPEGGNKKKTNQHRNHCRPHFPQFGLCYENDTEQECCPLESYKVKAIAGGKKEHKNHPTSAKKQQYFGRWVSHACGVKLTAFQKKSISVTVKH